MVILGTVIKHNLHALIPWFPPALGVSRNFECIIIYMYSFAWRFISKTGYTWPPSPSLPLTRGSLTVLGFAPKTCWWIIQSLNHWATTGFRTRSVFYQATLHASMEWTSMNRIVKPQSEGNTHHIHHHGKAPQGCSSYALKVHASCVFRVNKPGHLNNQTIYTEMVSPGTFHLHTTGTRVGSMSVGKVSFLQTSVQDLNLMKEATVNEKSLLIRDCKVQLVILRSTSN